MMKFFSINNKKHTLIIGIIITVLSIIGITINITYKNNLSNASSKMENTEVELDNWEISTVFYDSTVDGGVTPLTEINWDASDGSYKKGEARIITVQINYKNTNIATTYNPGELEINIANLIYKYNSYNYSAFDGDYVRVSYGVEDIPWDIKITVGANDEMHTGYDWNFDSGKSPNTTQEVLTFSNAYTLEAKSNLEGSIQIVYELTPKYEEPEEFLEECIHEYSTTLQAKMVSKKILVPVGTVTSPNWPNNYPNSMGIKNNYWEYEGDTLSRLSITFDTTSKLNDANDYIYIFNKYKTKMYEFNANEFVGKTYDLNSNYVKLAMKSNSYGNSNGFSATINEYKTIAESQIINFNYTRKYTHNWEYRNASLDLRASEIISLDQFPEGEYYWVKYEIWIRGYLWTDYPHIGLDYYIEDTFPVDCVVLNDKFEQMDLVDGYYMDDSFSSSHGSYNDIEYVYVGYPKNIYNETNNNLNVSNKVDFYIKYHNSEEYNWKSEDTVNINLENFDFVYEGELYSLSKEANQYNGILYSEYLLDENFFHNSTSSGYPCAGRHVTTATKWDMKYSAVYSGNPLTIQAGDDLLYITDENSNYRKLTDDEYFFEYTYLPFISNMNGTNIDYNKYITDLYVRYANEEDYVFYKSLSENKALDKIEFNTDKKVVGFYIQINDANESLILTPRTNYAGYSYSTNIQIKPKGNISSNGKIYNFSFLNSFFKDSDGTLQLQNSVELNNYSTIATQINIAKYDLKEYGYYVQRAEAFVEYTEANVPQITYKTDGILKFSNVIQDAENEKFEVTMTLKFNQFGDYSFENIRDDTEYMNSVYFKNINRLNLIKYQTVYDLLPKGMEVSSNSEEIISTMFLDTQVKDYYKYYYNSDGTQAFSTSTEMLEYHKKHSKFNIIENWNNTGRTKIEWVIDFSDNPLLYTGPYCRDGYGNSSEYKAMGVNINLYITYDSYLEYGRTYKNYVYSDGTDNYDNRMESYWEVTDNGKYDSDAYDINENDVIDEMISSKNATVIITSAVSTYQDLTTYVQTDQNNYSTGVVYATYGSNYEYKLRARTGSSDVTNLIIYTNLEEGYNGRGHWKGEFLGIDTSYAESKGYTVKTYYSEKIDATNLLEDTSWKEYNDSIDKTKVKSLAFQYLDSNGNPAILPANSLTYILIKMRAPSDENIKTLAYNNSWTEWNAIDPITEQPVDFITGINSNTVKISLPNSVEYVDIELDLEKKWIDNDNEFGLRPSSIQYNIIANNDKENMLKVTMYNTDKSLDNRNIWTKTIEVPKYDEEGNIITYTIEEELTQTDNIYYVPSINNYSITNTLSKDLTINKKWLDNNNAYVTRPTSVIVKVLQNNELFKEIEITGELSTNEWTKTISVPIYDENGNEYKYTFEEQSIDGYISSFDSTTNTFTNTLSVDTNIIVTKNWKDNTNKYGVRPSNININIKQNNQVYKTITLSGTTDTWKSEELTIPMYDKQGIKYNYTIEEETVKGYGLVEYNQETLTITNTLKETTTLIVTKNWIDDSNSSQTRPTNLSVTILQNNKEFKTITLSGNTNTWTSNIEVPKYDENQNEYTYTIKENNENIITEYSDVLYGEDGLTVTNKLNKNIDLTITKKWKDFDNEYLTRPDTVTINLYRNNILYQELTLIGENNSWSTKVTNVPAYDDNGKKYIYTIEEVSNDKLSKYEKITYDQTTLTVTNEILNPPKVTLYFTVQNGYTEAGSDEVKFDEEGYKKVLEKYNINGDEDYTYTFELQNVETGEIHKGQLTTSGVLTFENISYGTYRAIEGEDEYFDFVEMLGIVEIPGVSFKEDENGGIITIKPTGEDITYGVNIINKIEEPASNPNTTNNSSKLIIVILSIVLCITILVLKRKFLKN